MVQKSPPREFILTLYIYFLIRMANDLVESLLHVKIVLYMRSLIYSVLNVDLSHEGGLNSPTPIFLSMTP